MRLVLILVCLMALAAPAEARTIAASPGQDLRTVLRQAISGDTIRLAPGIYRDCATIPQNNITLEGTGRPEDTVLTGVLCLGKAAIVTQGRDIVVRGLTLQGITNPDGNGAGIRAEGGTLTVEHVRFIENENGLLSAPNPAATITVRDSLFLRNGGCKPDCAHGIYAGRIAMLRVERSRFSETHTAHHIKSRAAQTEVIDCDLSDGPMGDSSYQIELPNGGGLVARRNRIQKGPRVSNPVVISIGAEGASLPDGEIAIEGNRLSVDGTTQVTFVRNQARTPARLVGNSLPAGVVPLIGPGTVR